MMVVFYAVNIASAALLAIYVRWMERVAKSAVGGVQDRDKIAVLQA